MSGPLVLQGCDALIGPNLKPVTDASIVVEDGLIVEITQRNIPGESIDASGYLAVPGLINCHTHIGDAAFFGKAFGLNPAELLWPPDGLRHKWMSESGPETVRDGINSALEIMVGSGTVLFADFREQGLAGVQLLKDILRSSSVEAILFGRHEAHPLHEDAELEANVGQLTDRQLADIRDVLEVADGFSPLWANETTDRGLSQTAEIVRQNGSRLATHAGETPEYRAISKERTGAGDIERIIRFLDPDFVVHLTSTTRVEMELLVEAQIPGVMCPSTQAALGIGIPPFLQAVDSGLPIGLGTDNAMITMPDLLNEMNFYYRALRGVTQQAAAPLASQILSAATTTAAQVLGVESTHGHIDIGRPAHLFMVSTTGPAFRQIADPTVGVVCAATSADVHLTIIEGEIAHRAGRFE